MDLISKEKKVSISFEHIYSVVLKNNKLIFSNPNYTVLKILKSLQEEGYSISIFFCKSLNSEANIIEKIKQLLIEKNLQVDAITEDKLLRKDLIVYQGINLSLQEFILKYKYKKIFPSISIVSSFYNEEKNIDRFWLQANELSKYLNIEEFIFVDNGSDDNTFSKLCFLAQSDSRVRYIRNEKPTSYSLGFSSGIEKVTSKYTLISHSDCQINIDTTIKRWLESFSQVERFYPENSKFCIFSYRLNRPPLSQLLSFINNIFSKSILSWPNIVDFNAQPKLIHSSLLTNFYFDKGYLFDLALINRLKKLKKYDDDIKFLKPMAVIDSPRLEGNSSWSSSPIKFLKISLSYVFFSLSLKFNEKKNQ